MALRTLGLLTLLGLTTGQVVSQPIVPVTANAVTGFEIGMPHSLFQGVPKFLVDRAADPFKQLMKDRTGLAGTVSYLPDAMTAAEQLDAGKLQLAVFQGHEFAWVKAKYPNLSPIAIITPAQPKTQSYLMVRWDAPAKTVADLKGKTLTLAAVTKDHVRLFLDREKQAHLPADGIGASFVAASVQDALDDVVDGKADVTAVDLTAINYYKSLNPGRYTSLRVLAVSEEFPAPCIVIKTGDLNVSTVASIRNALSTANATAEGKKLMSMWKLQGFDAVPVGYDEHLKSQNKAYPLSVTRQVRSEK